MEFVPPVLDNLAKVIVVVEVLPSGHSAWLWAREEGIFEGGNSRY